MPVRMRMVMSGSLNISLREDFNAVKD